MSPKSNSSFNNNLSELDTLLQDLSNAKYANTGSLEKKKVNGSSSPVKTTNPVRPTVDSLLDELSSPLSNGTTG